MTLVLCASICRLVPIVSAWSGVSFFTQAQPSLVTEQLAVNVSIAKARHVMVNLVRAFRMVNARLGLLGFLFGRALLARGTEAEPQQDDNAERNGSPGIDTGHATGSFGAT